MTTIAQERAALAKVGRPLRSREQAGFRFPDYDVPRSVTEPARAQFVHITITNPSNYSSDDAHARAVEAIGISRFPSTGVSYNRLHMQSGRAYEGQPIGRRGAHTVNDKGLSSCVTSGCPSRGAGIPSGNLNYSVRAYAICQNVGHAVTDAELDSLARSMAADQLAGFVVKDAPIHGHRCVSPKECPAARMWARMGELERLVNHYVAVGFGSPQEESMSAEDVQALKNYIDSKIATIASAAAEATWNEQIPDVLSPASGDTSAARTHLTWMPQRVASAVSASEAGRYAHIIATITEWEQDKDNFRHAEELAKLAELKALLAELHPGPSEPPPPEPALPKA